MADDADRAAGESHKSDVPPAAHGVGDDAHGAAKTPVTGRVRRIWVRALLVLATVLAIFSIFAIWANRQLLNPPNWEKTSSALLQKESIRRALAGYLLDQLYSHVNVEGELSARLPGQLRPLAGPIAGGLHSVAEQAAERALELPTVQDAWRRANRTANETLVTIVSGGGRHVAINGGTVTLNLRQVVADLARRLGLPASVAAKLPPSVANLKVLTSQQLGLVRNLAKALHALALALTIITALLYAFIVYLARGYRRRTLMWVGWSLVLAGLITLVGRKVGQGQLVSAITRDAGIEPAANDAYSVATGLLVQVASATMIVGVPLIAAAWTAGPGRLAVAMRRHMAPHLRERPALAYWVTAALLALVFIWSPIPATGNPLEMLLFTVLAFLGAHVLRVQAAAEFPDAVAVPWRVALGEAARSLGRSHGVAHGGFSEDRSKAGELERLAALHERGALTDEEYATAKHDVLLGA